ncbi:hypothetical protein BC939DRAFT_452396 [Gamsiella multidivaricata]|uniref:uncharacterized protein n=1 Tax=Gamsiella multidivaricata TaxID=101098 RepID=UPI00221FD676|nr:uncharacterized protein BC939DRAFT_452396 [Gamsiella multidivaricata]KAI7822973.1 hypothetical protein BC939DRAFT_452396 [Gamsiella multidivaricata]
MTRLDSSYNAPQSLYLFLLGRDGYTKAEKAEEDFQLISHVLQTLVPPLPPHQGSFIHARLLLGYKGVSSHFHKTVLSLRMYFYAFPARGFFF